MKPSVDILLVQTDETLPGNLREQLNSHGYPTLVRSGLNELGNTLERMSKPVLIVEGGSTEEASYSILKDLLKAENLFAYPVVFIGKDADAYESALTRFYSLGVTLNLPLSTQDVFDALSFITKRYVKERISSQAVKKKKTLRVTEESLEKELKIESNLGNLPTFFIGELENFNLLTQNLGGNYYPKFMNESHILDKSYLPQAPNVQMQLIEVTGKLGKWSKGHLHRQAYFAEKLIRPFGLDEKFIEAGKQSAMLFPIGFREKIQNLLREDYISKGHYELKKELCSRIKDSAMELATKHDMKLVAEITALLGKLIGEEQEAKDTSECIVASAIMVADLIDRICWFSGFWNPRNAYRVLLKCKSGQIANVHPRVLGVAIKFLSEAIASGATSMLLCKTPSMTENNYPESLEAADIESHEVGVAISNLTPGMKLSRPLLTYDGREVLEKDMTLDNDLIWRLWQLSSVRPLFKPVVLK